jgi:polysaccharide chain length determinant protein (PEP-CTERM system associated)
VHEQLNQVTGELRSALRFRWAGLAAIWIIALAGWAYVARMPDIYEAQASFFLDTSSLLQPVLEGQIVSTNQEARLAFLRESLLGRAEREAVARQVGLDVGIDDPIAYEAMLDGLAAAIRFDIVNTANRVDRESSYYYRLSFRHPDREKAIAVVTALVDTFIEGALGEARRNEDSTLVTLNELIAAREQDLNVHSDAITAFKRDNADSQPGAQGAYLARVQTERDELAEANRRLSSLESRRSQQEQQIARLRRVVPSSGSQMPPNSIAARIVEAERELASLLLRYTEENRLVIGKRREIEDLERQRAEELDALGLEGEDLARIELESNPVYQAAQIALNELDLQIAELETEIAQREDNVAGLVSLIDESLSNEAALAELDREYGEKEAELSELYRNRQNLILTLQASQAEQMDFREIDEPHASLTPVEPNRLKLILAVLIVAVGGGVAVCYGLAQLRPVFTSSKALSSFAELPVLGTVTNAWPALERAAFRQSVVRYSAALALFLLFFISVVGVETLGPGIDIAFGGG